MRHLLMGIISLSLVGCAGSQLVTMTDKKIDAPKIIALDSPRAPWVAEIEKRLKTAGFKVLRVPSRATVQETVSDTRKISYKDTEAQYVLHIEGYAPLDTMNRCFAGGYRFDEIMAELVDITTNETVFSYNDRGYSEDCPPLSKSIFGNIVKAVESSWK